MMMTLTFNLGLKFVETACWLRVGYSEHRGAFSMLEVVKRRQANRERLKVSQHSLDLVCDAFFLQQARSDEGIHEVDVRRPASKSFGVDRANGLQTSSNRCRAWTREGNTTHRG